MSNASQGGVLVFLPTFNDLELLGSLTHDVVSLGEGYSPLVIDDGSYPAVERASLAPGSMVFHAPTNFGLGTASHIAFDHALRHGYRAVVRIDADGQHPVASVPSLLAPLDEGRADIVVGVRTNRNKTSGPRNLAATIVRAYLALVARWMSGGGAPSDVNSGFFAANPKAARVLNTVRLERFPEPQMYMLAPRRGLTIAEILIEQSAREHGRSTVTLGHALRIFYGFNIVVLAELLQGSRTT